MKARIFLFFLAGSLALIMISGLALACPSKLKCSNFTQPDKRADCNYVISQGLSTAEKNEIICILWDNEYSYSPYQMPNYGNFEPSLYLEAQQINNSRFILAGKITLFLILNYFIISLTKSAYFKKCLHAV